MVVTPTSKDIQFPVRIIRQTKTKSCWHAAAEMVLAHRGVGMSLVSMTNIETMFRVISNSGLDPIEIGKFASEVGLESSQLLFSNGFSVENYSSYLKSVGPLWMAGVFPGQLRNQTRLHVIVVCGLAGDKFLIADPDPSVSFPSWISHSGLESIRSPRAYPLLYRAAK